jgi:hypothetical protein
MGNVARGNAVPTIFSTQDRPFHELMNRLIAQLYAINNLRRYESTKTLFLSKVWMLADEGSNSELGTWLHWFATDDIMEITFGKRVGFLEREEDVDKVLKI